MAVHLLTNELLGRPYDPQVLTAWANLYRVADVALEAWGEWTDLTEPDDATRVAGYLAHLLDRRGITWMRARDSNAKFLKQTASGNLRERENRLVAHHLLGRDDEAEELAQALLRSGGAPNVPPPGPTFEEFVEAFREHLSTCAGADAHLPLRSS